MFETTRPLAAADVQRVRNEEQYGSSWTPVGVPWTLRQQGDEPGMELALAAGGSRYLALNEALPDLGWTLTLTADSRAVALARQQAWGKAVDALSDWQDAANAARSALATAEARLVGPDGTLYAHATTTCLVFDLPAQSRG